MTRYELASLIFQFFNVLLSCAMIAVSIWSSQKNERLAHPRQTKRDAGHSTLTKDRSVHSPPGQSSAASYNATRKTGPKNKKAAIKG